MTGVPKMRAIARVPGLVGRLEAIARDGKLHLRRHEAHDPAEADPLIDAVHKHLPTNHRYLALRKKALKLNDGVHMYDTYAPIVSGIEKHHTWAQAAKTVTDMLGRLTVASRAGSDVRRRHAGRPDAA